MIKTVATGFSGGGGFECGAIEAGLEPLWGIECNPKIAECYLFNIGAHVTVDMIEQVNFHLLPVADWEHFSPSCKNASTANQNGGETESDKNAADAVVRAIVAHKPKVLSLENVWKYRDFVSFKMILGCLKNLEYVVQFKKVCVADYGVPQTRERLILIATRKDMPVFRWPHPTHHDGPPIVKRNGGIIQSWIGWYQAIEDLIPTLPETEFAAWQLERLPTDLSVSTLVGDQHSHEGRQVTTREQQQPSFTVDTRPANKVRALLIDSQQTGRESTVPHGAFPANTVIAYNRPSHLPKAFLVAGIGNQLGGKENSSLIIRDGESRAFTVPANTGKAPARAWLEQGRVVKMTPRALARFQSIPDWYRLPEKATLACEIIGNAVPSLLGKVFIQSYQQQIIRRVA